MKVQGFNTWMAKMEVKTFDAMDSLMRTEAELDRKFSKASDRLQAKTYEYMLDKMNPQTRTKMIEDIDKKRDSLEKEIYQTIDRRAEILQKNGVDIQPIPDRVQMEEFRKRNPKEYMEYSQLAKKLGQLDLEHTKTELTKDRIDQAMENIEARQQDNTITPDMDDEKKRVRGVQEAIENYIAPDYKYLPSEESLEMEPDMEME